MELAEPREDPTPSLREFLYHAHDQRGRALSVAGAILALALVASAVMPPDYRATATLVVLPSPEFTVREAAGSHDSNASALALDQIMKAETEILGSDDLHAATLRKLGPASIYPEIFAPEPRSLPRRWLHSVAGVLLSPWRVPSADEDAARLENGLRRFRSNLSVLPARDSNVVTVTFDSRDGRRAAAIVNAMLGLYATSRTRLYDDPQLDIVRRDAEAAARSVADADRALATFKQAHAISDYAQERGLLLSRRSQELQSIDDATAASVASEARLEVLSRLEKAEPETIGLYEEKDPDTRLQIANAGLQDLRAKLAAARDKYKDTSRVVSALRAEIAANGAEAARLSSDAAASVVRKGRNPSLDPLHLDRVRSSAELSASRARLTALWSQSQQISAALEALDSQEAALSLLERQKTTAEQAYREASRILADRHLSEAEDARRLANVRVIQPATVPQYPRALPLLVVTAGLVLSFVAACASVVMMFVSRPVFLTREGLESAIDLPVLAVFERPVERRTEQLLKV